MRRNFNCDTQTSVLYIMILDCNANALSTPFNWSYHHHFLLDLIFLFVTVVHHFLSNKRDLFYLVPRMRMLPETLMPPNFNILPSNHDSLRTYPRALRQILERPALGQNQGQQPTMTRKMPPRDLLPIYKQSICDCATAQGRITNTQPKRLRAKLRYTCLLLCHEAIAEPLAVITPSSFSYWSNIPLFVPRLGG